MAVKTKAAILTQLQAVVAALNLAYADTVSGMAAPLKDARHPLRRIDKLLEMQHSGTIVVNTDYFDKIFNVAGTEVINAPNSGSRTLMKNVP